MNGVYCYRVRNVRVYSAIRKSTVSVMRDKKTPRVIDPAITAAIVIIAGGIGLMALGVSA